jgi:uncharacterized membrane protein
MREIMTNPLKRMFGDPTHPAVVHFPLALYPAAVLFDLLAFTRGDGSLYTHGAFILMLAATIGAVVAMTTGFAQLPDIAPDSPAWKTAILHMSVQMGAAGIFLASILLRLRHVDDVHPPIAAVICAIIGLAVLFYGGWLGGHMVFSQGVGVEMAADGQTTRAIDIEPVPHTDAPMPT